MPSSAVQARGITARFSAVCMLCSMSQGKSLMTGDSSRSSYLNYLSILWNAECIRVDWLVEERLGDLMLHDLLQDLWHGSYQALLFKGGKLAPFPEPVARFLLSRLVSHTACLLRPSCTLLHPWKKARVPAWPG